MTVINFSQKIASRFSASHMYMVQHGYVIVLVARSRLILCI